MNASEITTENNAEPSHGQSETYTSSGTLRPNHTIMAPAVSAPQPHYATDEDSTDYEDAEEADHASKPLEPRKAFRPINNDLTIINGLLAPPPIDTTILTSMPTAKDASMSDTNCDESASSYSMESTSNSTPKWGRSRSWSDDEDHPQRVCAHWQSSDDSARDISTKKWLYGSDQQQQGVSALGWPYDLNVIHQHGVYAHKWPYGTDFQGVSAQKWQYDPNVALQGLPSVEWNCSSLSQRNVAAEKWQHMFMQGYPQTQITQPQPAVPVPMSESVEVASRSVSQESYRVPATTYCNALNRVPESAEKDPVSSWIPPASYPAGASGMLSQFAQRNQNLKDIMLANSGINSSCLNENDDCISSQDEEDDGLDE